MAGKYEAYPEYKDSGLTWLGMMPSHWELRKSKYLFTRMQREIRLEDGVITAFRDGQVTLRSKRRTDGFTQSVKEIGYQGVRVGDLLVHAMDGFAGAIGVSDSDGKCSPVCSVCIPRKPDKIHMPYYGYLVRQLAVTDFISSLAKGIRERSTEFRYSEFSALDLALPPIYEQTQIANFLDHETAKIDTLIEEQQSLIRLLQEKRQAVISHAVTKGLNPQAPMKDSGVEWLGEVPEHWGVAKIKYIAELTPKKTEVEKEKFKRCSFVPMEKLKTDSLLLDETRFIEEVFDGYTYFKNEDILLAKVTPCFENKNMAIARNMENGIGFGSSEIYVLRVRIQSLNEFLYFRLQEDTFIDAATGAMTGAGGLKRVPSDFINNYPLALPPESERHQIVEHIKRYCSKYDLLIKDAEEAILLMQERRTALISAAVTGKIDVRNWQQPPSEKQEQQPAVEVH